MIQYDRIKSVIVDHIQQGTGHPVILQAQTGPQPEYPFATYTVTSPYLPVSEAEEGDALVEDVELVYSFTWHSKDATEAQSLAHQTAMLFKLRSYRMRLGFYGLAVVRVEPFQNRDTFLTIENERRVGFDVRFRIRNKDAAPFDTIESVQ